MRAAGAQVIVEQRGGRLERERAYRPVERHVPATGVIPQAAHLVLHVLEVITLGHGEGGVDKVFQAHVGARSLSWRNVAQWRGRWLARKNAQVRAVVRGDHIDPMRRGKLHAAKLTR